MLDKEDKVPDNEVEGNNVENIENDDFEEDENREFVLENKGGKEKE